MASVLLLAELFVRVISPSLIPPRSPDATEASQKAAKVSDWGAQPPQMMAMGDSAMDAAFSPSQFISTSTRFRTSYNASLMGARFSAQQLWADLVLDDGRPELALQGIHPATVLSLDARMDEAVVDSRLSSTISSLDGSIGHQIEDIASDYSYLVRYRGSLRSPREVAAAIGRRARSEPAEGLDERTAEFWQQALARDGQVQLFKVGEQRQATVGLRRYLSELLRGNDRIDQLDVLVSAYQRHGVPVILVIPPVSLETFSDNDLDATVWLRTVDRIVQRSNERGIPIIDFTRAGFGRELYFDALHLNEDGSDRFSRELARRTDELCTRLPSLRCPPTVG